MATIALTEVDLGHPRVERIDLIAYTEISTVKATGTVAQFLI